MSDLDRWLGRGPLTAAPAKEGTNPDIRQTNSDNVEVPLSDQDGAWLKMAVSDPAAWRKKNNPYTNRIAQMIADDSMLPRDGQVGKHIWGVAVSVMNELQSPEIAEEAIQECRRTKENWRELSIWIMRSEIQFAGRRLKARQHFVGHLGDDPIEAEDPGYECPRCHQVVLNEAILTDDCRHHFGRREDYFAWQTRRPELPVEEKAGCDPDQLSGREHWERDTKTAAEGRGGLDGKGNYHLNHHDIERLTKGIPK